MPLQRAVGAPQHLRTSLNLPRLQEEEGADRMLAGGGAMEGNLLAVPNRSLQENPTSEAVRRRRERARNEAMGCGVPPPEEDFTGSRRSKQLLSGTIIGAAAGLGVSTVALPAVLGAAGFTAAGIAAGSLGAKMMSAAAIANGGGVAAGGLVATLQSLGAAGAPVAVKAAMAGVGAVLGALV